MAGGLTFCTEVQKRLAGRFQAVDIISYVNRGYSLVVASCPLVFDHLVTTNMTVTNSISTTLPSGLDASRKVTAAHTNGVPIPKATDAQILNYTSSLLPSPPAASGFKGVGSSLLFDGWFWVANTGAPQPSMEFVPFQTGSVQVSISYHQMPAQLIYTLDTPATIWSGSVGTANQWMDDLVIDYAELELKRILNYVGWQELEARFQARLMSLRMMADGNREDTGDVQENQLVEQSKVNLGRT